MGQFFLSGKKTGGLAKYQTFYCIFFCTLSQIEEDFAFFYQ